MRWLFEHPGFISALTGFGTLLVWLIYLQVFISSYRRQTRAMLLIARGPGNGLDARCFLSNMSSGAVYVQSVQGKLETQECTLAYPMTDMLDFKGHAFADSRLRTRQGPLGSGEIMDIGSFSDLVHRVLHDRRKVFDMDLPEDAVRAITIEVLGIYGSEDLPIGAARRFVVDHNHGRSSVKGEGLETKQIRKRRQRRRLMGDLEREL